MLAVPVIGLVIAASLARRISPGRPVLLVLYLLVGTITISALSTGPTGARSAASPAPIADRAFRPVPDATASLSSRPTDAIAPSIAGAPVPEATPAPRAAAAPRAAVAPEAPAVVRFRPRDGWTGVSRFADVSVRFGRPMEHDTTEQAFHVLLGEKRVEGTVRWVEGDTVLVLDPTRPLPYRARVELSVDVSARSADGVALREARSVTFTVQPRPAPTVRPAPTARPAPASTAWRWPLLGPITQRFGESLTQYGFHQGIDIDGATGDRVRAARGGRVVVAGTYDQCGGLEVHVDHGDGFASWYRHLSRIEVAKGIMVDAGAVIGRVGNTGCSLGSHLHFGIRRGTKFVDPLRYLPPR